MVANKASPGVRYRCTACDTVHPTWSARCQKCGAFKVASDLVPALLASQAQAPVDAAPAAAPPAPIAAAHASPVVLPSSNAPVPLSDVEAESYARHVSGLGPFDEILGGGLVVGSLVLLSSDPGSGKSTLVNQALDGMRLTCLYATGEETVPQVAARARRIDAASPRVYIVAETRLEVILQHATSLSAEVIAIDSIQTLTCDDAPGRAGSISQVKECIHRLMKFAKTTGIAVLVIGHVTGDSSIAGPKTLEHMVDAVIMLEVTDGYERRLTSSKNRFGSTAKIGKLVMTSTGLEPARFEATDDGDDDDSGNGGGHPPGGFH